jgi:tetratricopeptide (TPR) repeat protein
MPESVKKSFVVFTYFVLILSTLLVFWQVRNFGFVGYDDNEYVYENPHVLNGLTKDGVIWAFTADVSSHWHPLTWLSLMLDCQLFGSNPGRIHLVNLLLHIVNTLLLFAVLKKMTGSLWPSAFVAAAFALHPMHVESVAWIAERKDVLSTFFLLLTLAAYASHVSRPSIFWYIAALAAFALGLMAKSMLVTLPFVLLLLDYWPLNRFMLQTVAASGRRGRKSAPAADEDTTLYRIIIEKVPFLALSIISSVVAFLVMRAGGIMVDINAFPLRNRATNAFLSYAKYICKLFWPRNLAVFYPFYADSFVFWQVAICVLLLLVISIFVICFGRNRKYLPVGWFWFVGTLVPVIGFVQVGVQALADRYTYISYIGLFIMIAWGLPELLSKWPQRKIALGLSMAIILTVLGICAHQQVSCWNNSITLFSHALAVTQNNYVAYNNLGVAYGNLGRYTEAIDVYKQAIKINPYYYEAYFNLGFSYGSLGCYTEAIDACRQAIKIKPDYAKAYNNLGNAYSKLSRRQDAIDAYQQAVKFRPDYAKAHYNLGRILGNLNRWQEAIEAFRQAVKFRPDLAEAHYNLGNAYLAIGDKNSALAEYNILKSLNSRLADNLFNRINK